VYVAAETAAFDGGWVFAQLRERQEHEVLVVVAR
jgi:hypothetical protein